MIPTGFMAKRIVNRPEWLQAAAVEDILSVSGHISEAFADTISAWQHNGFWLFNAPQAIQSLAAEQAVDLNGCRFFYYEVFELEFDVQEGQWRPVEPEKSFPTAVQPWEKKQLEGFDVVTFSSGTAPECSPLSCNRLAETVPVNRHCLLESIEDARRLIDAGAFEHAEPGPFRIFSVWSCSLEQ